MATTLTNGETYVFAKVNNKAVITSGTDDAYQSTKNIRTDVAITGNTDITGDIKVGDSPSGAAQIHISSSSNPRILIEDDTESFVRLGIKTSDTHDAYLGFHDNKRLVIGDMSSRTSTIPSSDLVISSSYVGIGTSTPGHRLDVEENANAFAAKIENHADAGHGLILQLNRTPPTWENYFIDFREGDGDSRGHIVGSTSGVNFVDDSDRRLKSDIVDTSYGISDLLKLKVRDYRFTKCEESTTGLIAQEVMPIYPAPVTNPVEYNKAEKLSPGDSGYRYMGIDYGKFTPLLIKAVQDQQKVIDDLQERITKLENI